MDSQIELDDRMTEETKVFMLNSLKLIRPSQLVVLDVNVTRKARIANALKTNEAYPFPELKQVEYTVKNKNDNHEIRIVSYVPNNLRENSPITVFYHGGGWTFGANETYYQTLARLATSTRSVWVYVEYRLSPETKFPVPLTDCISALEWVVENKTLFSSANAKIGVSGDSSGGHYAALIANDYNHLINYQVSVYPCLHFGPSSYESEKEFTKECFYLVPELIAFFGKNLLADNSLVDTPQLSPILNEDFSKLPPSLLIVAELDPLVDHSKHYHSKLTACNVQSELRIVKGTVHGFFSQPIFLKNAFNELQDHIVQFLEKF